MKPRVAVVGPLVAGLALVGCTLTQPAQRKVEKDLRPLLASAGGQGGRLILPKRCSLRVMIVTRPAHDTDLNEALWRDADPQAVADEARRGWEANGLRIGRVTGDLPDALRKKDAHDRTQSEPATICLPNGDSTLVDLGPAAKQLSLFLTLPGGRGAVGRPYRDAKPNVRITATHDDAGIVTLRVVPEIHHGPIQQGWSPAPGGPFSGNQFMVKSGQQEDALRELAATLTLRPGQFAVLGCDPGRAGSLGEFLFTEAEGTSDRPHQKALLIWAGRADPELPLVAPPAGLVPADPPAEPAPALQ